ncbi:MAG: DUF1080 domain-containing protein [Verrucomicrobiales bacterium]|nr:DUF1080 domain-containing protein [Verrucomicrobiales bacterium]MCP5556606.1 DUF1080 domain-containing protein [Verrucomicrobiaceae bacterium]
MKIVPCFALAAIAIAGVIVAGHAADEPKEPSEWVLFDGKSLDDWEAVDVGGSGTVELDEGELIINLGEGVGGAVYKKAAALPVTNYEITLEAMRVSGVDFFCGLTFPVGDLKTCATLICGGWGGSVTGISSIDDLDAANNATGTYQRYEDEKWYKIRMRVTPENLSAWVDDKQVVDIDIKDRKISVRPGPIESYLPLSVTSYNTAAAFRNIKMKKLPEAAAK